MLTSYSVTALDKVTPGETAQQETSTSINLTDEQRYESQTYVHEGLSQRQAQEACEKLDDPNACNGRGSTKFLGMDSNLVQGIARMYSLFSGVMGSQGGKLTNKAGEQTTNDYCAYIPAAGELAAGAVQQAEQQKIENTPVSSRNAQKERLYQAARSHGTRAKTAKMQGTIWGTATACYGVLVATGKAKVDKKVLMRAGAAGFLTAFWLKEAKQQQKYEKEVKGIADSLPGEGDCNPHTETHCYCAQPETMYDPQHCINPVTNKPDTETTYQVPCTTSGGASDPQCLCVGEDNCLDTQMFSNMKLPGIASFAATPAANDARNLFRGTLSAADLNSSSSGQKAATRTLLGQLESQIADPARAPTSQEIGVSKELQGLGIPPKLARQLAMTRSNGFGQARAARLSSSTAPASIAGKTINSGRSNVLTFQGGNKDIGGNKKASSSNPSIANIMKRYQKKNKRGSNSKVLRFAEQAQRNASIHKKSDKPIFDIISRRYMISGRRHLKVD